MWSVVSDLAPRLFSTSSLLIGSSNALLVSLWTSAAAFEEFLL
jgi:hypothetical protein